MVAVWSFLCVVNHFSNKTVFEIRHYDSDADQMDNRLHKAVHFNCTVLRCLDRLVWFVLDSNPASDLLNSLVSGQFVQRRTTLMRMKRRENPGWVASGNLLLNCSGDSILLLYVFLWHLLPSIPSCFAVPSGHSAQNRRAETETTGSLQRHPTVQKPGPGKIINRLWENKMQVLANH